MKRWVIGSLVAVTLCATVVVVMRESNTAAA